MLRVEVADGLVSYGGGGEGSDLGADPGGVVGPAGVSPGGPGLGIGPVVSGEHWRGASGSGDRTRTPTDSCASTSPSGRASPATAKTTSTPSPGSSTAGLDRP